jgi:hypothetical protein
VESAVWIVRSVEILRDVSIQGNDRSSLLPRQTNDIVILEFAQAKPMERHDIQMEFVCKEFADF